MKLSRRSILALVGVAIIGVLAPAGQAVLRYPPPQFTPEKAPVDSGDADGSTFRASARGAIFQGRDGDRFVFRAFAPEPDITVQGSAEGAWQVEVRNVHPEAMLSSGTPDLDETKSNLARTVSGSAAESSFRFHFPKRERYRFAAIGDTGGGSELRWVLARADALGADFVLHLGDFNYGKGDYLGSVAAFDAARIPTYVAIGNHDFYEGLNSIHKLFRQYIGPMNASFELGGVMFVNIDTAAGFIPPGGGARGEFLSALERREHVKDVVVFTHKPLTDPRPEERHSIPSLEYGFLRGQLQRLGADTVLAGHIHIKEDFEDDGIRTLISGQGLAHADLIVDRPIAELLLADVTPDSNKVDFHWAPLEMPFEMHCNPRAWEVLVALDKPGVLRQLKEICAKP